MLAVDDAVGNKVTALFSRGEVRDYLDVDSIRRSGRYDDERLLQLGKRADRGFDLGMLVHRLDRAGRFEPDQVRRYNVDATQLAALQERCATWAVMLRARIALAPGHPFEHGVRNAPPRQRPVDGRDGRGRGVER